MRRLKNHPFYVNLNQGKIRLCRVKDGGPEWFAGDFSYSDVPHPTSSELISDIAETLQIAVGEVESIIAKQMAEKSVLLKG